MQNHIFFLVALTAVVVAEVHSLTNINQEWRIELVGENSEGPIVRIKSARSNKCVENKDRSKSNGNSIHQAYCWKDDTQNWIQIERNDHFMLKNVMSGKCLDVTTAYRKEGPVQQWTCNYYAPNMQWKYEDQRLISKSSAQCLTVPNGATGNGVLLTHSKCT